jgi:hypothetical protein
VENITIKHITSAIPLENGVVEIEATIPNFIFNSKKVTRLEFRNADRAEELMCFLGQGEANT